MEFEFNTIAELFLKGTKTFARNKLYFDKVNGEWVGKTYGEVREIVENFAFGLASLGIGKDDKVAILSANNSKWAMSDFAIISLGAVTVSVYPTLIPPQIKYILQDSETKYIITQDKEQTEKVLSFLDDDALKLEGIIVMEPDSSLPDKMLTFDDVVDKGKTYKQEADFVFEERAETVQPDDLLTLIYTSGTTGNPKGVMLCHRNLASNIIAARKVIEIGPEDRFLSFLPLSHSFERMAGHFTAFSCGGQIYYAESIDKVAENMLETHPTVMTSVPRLYEKMYNRVVEKVSTDSPLKQKIFWWAIKVGKQCLPYLQVDQPLPGGLNIKYQLANKLVYSKLKERVGGKLRFFVSGAAPLSPEIGVFFAAAGLKILEGYGLTETSPVITINHPDHFKFGTVGFPIEEVEVKIAEDGEILCRGDNVMLGYYNNPEATTEVLEPDGWFHTGDVGEFDEDNFLKITDRKKSLLVTSGGKNVAPAPLENALSISTYVDQALVIGDKRKFVSALIVPDFTALAEWARKEGLPTDNIPELLKHEKVRALYDQIIADAMNQFSRYERVKKYHLVDHSWSIGTGELTPTLKVKRKMVKKKYAQAIDALYED